LEQLWRPALDKIIFFFLIFVSCGKHPDQFFVDEKLKFAFQEFINEAKNNGKELDFSKLKKIITIKENSKILGRCLNNEIQINITQANDQCRITVSLFHELGHCVLFLPHFDEGLDIMNTKINESCVFYFLEWNQMMARIFKGKSQ